MNDVMKRSTVTVVAFILVLVALVAVGRHHWWGISAAGAVGIAIGAGVGSALGLRRWARRRRAKRGRARDHLQL
jgi:preprotein translocase subunit SecF